MSKWYTIITLLLVTIILSGCGGEPPASPASEEKETPPSTTEKSQPEQTTNNQSGDKTTLRLVQVEDTVIEVQIDNVNDLYALALEIEIDPAQVQVVDSDPNQSGVQIEQGQIPSPDFVIPRTETAGDNIIEYIVIQLPPREPFSGSGVIATIKLTEPPADLSAISVKKADLSTPEGEPIEVIIQNLEM
jgi:hypothetical protein